MLHPATLPICLYLLRPASWKEGVNEKGVKDKERAHTPSASRLHARTPPRHAVERIRHQPSPPDQPERRRSVTVNWRMNSTNAPMERPQTDLMFWASNVNRLIRRSKSGNAFLFREEIAASPPITFNHHPGIRKQGKGDSQKSSTHPHPHSHNPHPRRQGMWAGWAELCVLFARKRSP
ncbi:hypothetical protein TESG_08568 [Trichophyton tonsurans CBS 112818]|uniref:Uncharacterized protein n=1 Tax=Trichophyton tonsurans (strain CBS 112818) TaxID=647933 RepID=F2S5K6_TRIT1|nr:hypothetical protein TESG_08568 [Trichophyton tonsurans CBS 112818]